VGTLVLPRRHEPGHRGRRPQRVRGGDSGAEV